MSKTLTLLQRLAYIHDYFNISIIKIFLYCIFPYCIHINSLLLRSKLEIKFEENLDLGDNFRAYLVGKIHRQCYNGSSWIPGATSGPEGPTSNVDILNSFGPVVQSHW